MVKNIAATVGLKRADAANLRVTALDFNGYPRQEIGNASDFKLLPDCFYYVIRK